MDSARILEEIDLARCRAQWSSLPDLIKKYKKVHPEDQVLDITVSAEVELIRILNENKKIHEHEPKGWDTIHQNDKPNRIALLPRVDPPKVQPILNRLESIIEKKQDDWQVQLSKILLARIYFETGQYKLALLSLQNLALRAEDVQSGYGLVQLVQARAIKGMCLELQEDYAPALDAYESAWEAVESQPQERGVMLSFWIEECLYRGTLTRLRLNHSVKQTLGMMRAYLRLVSSHWSPQWRMFRRWVLFKYYTDYVVSTFKNGTYIPPNDNKLLAEKAAFEEISSLMNLYRHLFSLIAPLLSTKSKSAYGLSLSGTMVHAYDILGWGETSHVRRVLQFLYQVKSVTFNNPTVTRYMFFTLMRLGSLEEAKLSLRSYLEILGIPDVDAQLVHNQLDRQTDFSLLVSSLKSKMADTQESFDDVLDVLSASIQLYGHEEQNGHLATFLSDLALELVNQDDASVSLEKKVKIHRIRGAAYSTLASQSEEHVDRASFHETAAKSLETAVELDPNDWKSHYELGLQKAIMRDTHAAVQSAHQSIKLNPQSTASWHLLALLYSCKRTDNLSKATQSLEAGLQMSYSSKYELDTTSSQGIPVFSWTEGEHTSSELYEKAETYMSLRMTQTALLEAVQGPDVAMKQYEELFSTYTHLTYKLGLSPQQLLLKQLENEVPPSPSTPSRKSSISLLRRTSDSSFSSLTGRRRSSSVEEKKSPVDTNGSLRRAESDTDDMSDDSTMTGSTITRSSSRRLRKHSRKMQRSESVRVDSAESRKKSLQLIDLGMARRIGTAAAAPAQHNGTSSRQDSSRSLVNGSDNKSTAISLASLLTPAYSKGSLRSNSISGRSSSVVATRDGLVISTFQQHQQAFELRKKTRWQSLLVTLWLMSAQTFLRAGRLDEVNKAIGEAEQLGLGDPGVWHQLGQLSLKVQEFIKQKKTITPSDLKVIKEMSHVSIDAFEKALTLDPEHIPSQVAKATRLIELDEWELAEGLLEEITLGLGWDSAQAWYQQAQVMQHYQDLEQTKACLLYSLELFDTEPIRSFSVLPRFI